MPVKQTVPVLITGASGYLGGRLADILRNQFDLTLAVRDPQSLSNIPAYQGLKSTNIDMADAQNFSSALEGIHTIIHLAAMNHQDCEADPEKADKINVQGTKALVDAAIKAKVSQFIYLSTIHVYGAPLKGNLTEECITRPTSVYARTHLEAESEILNAHHDGKIRGIILRLANSLGPPVHPGIKAWNLVSNDLCRQAVVDKKMALKSSGLQERNFVSISFLAQTIEKLLQTSNASDGPIFNVGSSENISIWNLAQWIQERCNHVMGYKPELSRPPISSQDSHNEISFIFDISKLARIAGTDSKQHLQTEIDATLRFCKEMY